MYKYTYIIGIVCIVRNRPHRPASLKLVTSHGRRSCPSLCFVCRSYQYYLLLNYVPLINDHRSCYIVITLNCYILHNKSSKVLHACLDSSPLIGVTGLSGCLASLVHDAVSNPAEGENTKYLFETNCIGHVIKTPVLGRDAARVRYTYR